MSRIPDYDAGKVVKLGNGIEVTLGTVTTIENHPSGTQFDGLAVTVAAFRNSQGACVTRVVALADPAQRVVTKILRRPDF